MYTLLSNLPGMAYRCKNDKYWTMEFVSKGCLLLTGYWSSDLVYNKKVAYADLIAPDDYEYVWDTVQKAIDNNESFQVEYRLRTKNGEDKWVWEKGRAIYDEDGKVTAVEGFINDVTENKAIEQELKKSHKLFENLAKNVSVGIYKTDKNGQTTYVNPKWCEITGLQEHEAMGLRWANSIHPDDRERVKQNWQKLVENPGSYTTEYRYLHSNGEEVWVQGQISPDYDPEENIHGYIGTITVITERVQAEQRIKTNFNLLNTIIENIPDTLYMKDAEGRKLIANKNDIEACGAERFEDIKGKTDFEIFPPDIAQKYWEDDQKVLKKGEAIINKEEYLINKDGEEQWLQTSKIPFKNDRGEIIGLVGLGHDTTRQLKAEKERTKLSTAITQAPLGVVITNTDGVIEYVNPNFTETTGFSFDEAVGQKPSIIKSEMNTKELYAEMWSMITRGYDWRGELQNKTKNGELFWVNVIISPIKNEDGDIINYVAIEEDITYKKEMYEELVGAKNKAEESDRLKTSFLANMSHEIRTPLNSILGFTDLLKEAEHLSKSDRKEFSSIIEKSADSLLQIINDIIDISSLETKQLSIYPVRFKLNPLLDALCREYSGLAEKSTHDIEIKLLKPDHDIEVYADKNRLNQIFVNLLNNAMKFTPGGVIEFGITRYDKKYVYFKVEDSGI
ncbi:MAG TPA: PAS domain S-box protein, partial [Prolixibacteraceae bacterium]|nr:PAS domain S-box protein [Prolixibacteraceae bacterium]